MSIDQYKSGQKSRTQKGAGASKKKNECYVGGTIFSEHASSFIWNSNQFSLRAGEILKSKENFENFLHDAGVTVKKYRADNGIFASKAFRADCEMKNQGLDFCGVGAKHQNGVAERA